MGEDKTDGIGAARGATSFDGNAVADHFVAIIDHIPTLAWIADADGYITRYNRHWHAYCGTDAAAMEGWGWQAVHDPAILPAVLERWAESIATGVPFEMVFPLRGADGVFRPFMTRVDPVRDDAGMISHWIGINSSIAPQAEAEAARAAAEARMLAADTERDAILEQLAEGVIVTDLAGEITYINAAATRLHGVAQLGVIPDGYSETYHLFTEAGAPYPPRDLPLARAVAGATVDEARWVIRRPDGSDVLAIGNARPLIGPDGAQVGAVLTIRDDTARAAAEREVREAEARLRTLTDNLPSGVVYQMSSGVDGSERRFLYVSESNQKLTGVPAAALLADATIAYRMMLPEYVPAMIAAEAVAIRDRTPLDISVRFRRADGEVRACRIISAPREQADGSLIWDGLQIDTTDQDRAEQMLRELNDTLETRVAERTAERNLLGDIVATTDAFILALDPDHRVLAINRANVAEFERIYGIRPAVGDDLLALLAHRPDARDAIAAPWARALSGEEFTIIDRFGDPAREQLCYEIRFRSLRDASGALIGAYHFAFDITDRLRAEHELEDAREALRQAQKMEAVGQLTGGIAHDFNNLLTVVAGNIDLAQRAVAASDAARAARTLGNALKGTARAATLTQRLLAFSRRQPLSPKPTDIGRLLTNMADLLARSIGEAVQIETVVHAGLWRAEIDGPQLENALVNLAVNARDAMPEGGKLTIEAANTRIDEAYAATHAEVGEGQYVMLSVTDTGHGMPAEVSARAFDPFFTTKDVGKGTGLGLSQVYGFVKQSGGHVKIYSEAGSGTTIKLYLPRLTGDFDDEEPEPVAEDADRGDASETVLVVEDDDDVRAFTVGALRELGYRVLECHDGPSALRLLARQETPIQLLLTDVVMPEMSGRELADTARRDDPTLKILFTTGYARNAIVHSGRLDPGVELLPKPFSIDALAAKVRAVLDQATSSRVLVIDADHASRMALIDLLAERGFAAEPAATPREALGKLRAANGHYGGAILDAALPLLPADALMRELRRLRDDLPILIVTARDADAWRVRLAEDACADVLAAPYGAADLEAALAGLRIACAITHDDAAGVQD